MRREQLPGYPRATYVMPRWQALYVSVNKAACTSLLWLVAELQGESPERFHRLLRGEVTRRMTIHHRRHWRHTPTAPSLSDGELARIDPHGDWLVFAVVRHPATRLFSAWQSKLLLREPTWVAEYGDAEWFPRVPRTGEDIVEDFGRFASALADGSAPVLRNRHFAPQHELVAPERMEYTRVYRTSELPQLLADLEAHVRARGYEGAPLALPHANETPLAPIPSLFSAGVQDACQKLYGADLAAFGFPNVVPGGLDPPDEYGAAAVAELGRLIDRAERIGDLAARAQALQVQLRQARSSPPKWHAGVLRRLKRRLARR